MHLVYARLGKVNSIHEGELYILVRFATFLACAS